mgnify:CR=1 FL=1
MELESVEAVTYNGCYGNVRNTSPNHMYKKYVEWAGDKSGKPLSFKEWLRWAKNKGMVKNMSVDGEEEAIEAVKKTGSRIGVALAVVIAVGLGFAFAKTKTA